MLRIRSKSKRWKQAAMTIVALIIIAVGLYILLTVLAPSMNIAIVTGRSGQETAKKLAEPAGSNGDRLFIPQINVDVAIVTGTDDSALEKGAWHRKPENGDPIKGGNFVLSAHRFVMSFTPQGTAVKSPFYNIGKLAIGDRLFVDYKGKRYQYEIKKKYAVAPTAVQIEAPSKEPKLTLYSCTLKGSEDGRDVIEAVPVTE